MAPVYTTDDQLHHQPATYTPKIQPNESDRPVLGLAGITIDNLPPQTADPEDLRPLLASLVEQAIPKLNDIAEPDPAARTFKQISTQSLDGSTAPIRLSKRTHSTPDRRFFHRRKETWIARESRHAHSSQPGTATWREFRACIKDRHVETEAAFTPTLVDWRRAREWKDGCKRVVVDYRVAPEGDIQRWGNFTLALVEVQHRMPSPLLKNRTFIILQMTCALEGSDTEFMVVTVPVWDRIGTNPDLRLSRRRNTVVGQYAAVERVRSIKATDGERDRTEWIMATASHPRGVMDYVPRRVVNHFVPGEIAKDVPLFLNFLVTERARNADYLASQAD